MVDAHSPGFLALVLSAKSHVRHFDVDEFVDRLRRGERFVIVDTREDHEWAAGHLPGAHHLSKGVLEREIEAAIPELSTPIVLYCDGGYRSVLAAESLGRMGYTNVASLDGGWQAWNERGLPVVMPGRGA